MRQAKLASTRQSYAFALMKGDGSVVSHLAVDKNRRKMTDPCMDVSKNSGKNPQNGWNTLFELDDLGGKPIFLETSMYVFGLFTYVFLADFHGKLVHPQSLTNGT